MFGINTSVSGGIYRTSNNMQRAQSELYKSLERIETGNKINRASDDTAGYAKALSLSQDLAKASTQKTNNLDFIDDLKSIDTLQTNILESLEGMREATVTYRDSVGDANAQAAALAEINQHVANINGFTGSSSFDGTADVLGAAAAATNIQWGTEATDVVSHTFLDLSTDAVGAAIDTTVAALDGTAGTATALIADIDSAIGNAMEASSRLGVTLNNTMDGAQSLLSDKISNLTDHYNQIMKTDEGLESSIVTSLQMRQQAMVSSIGIQNTFAASTLNLLA